MPIEAIFERVMIKKIMMMRKKCAFLLTVTLIIFSSHTIGHADDQLIDEEKIWGVEVGDEIEYRKTKDERYGFNSFENFTTQYESENTFTPIFLQQEIVKTNVSEIVKLTIDKVPQDNSSTITATAIRDNNTLTTNYTTITIIPITTAETFAFNIIPFVNQLYTYNNWTIELVQNSIKYIFGKQEYWFEELAVRYIAPIDEQNNTWQGYVSWRYHASGEAYWFSSKAWLVDIEDIRTERRLDRIEYNQDKMKGFYALEFTSINAESLKRQEERILYIYIWLALMGAMTIIGIITLFIKKFG